MNGTTREEAINAITQFIENYAYGNDLIGLKMAIEALKEERPQWIPCSERLPEEYYQYLVTIKNSSGSTFTTTSYFFTAETGWSHDGVIAWMPFPKAYKKEGDPD